jgi:serine/threonine protein kinase/S1-C subfamily serine protease
VPPALGRRIDEACDRFEAAWRSGSPPRLEDFVAGWEGAERAALLRELILLDADYRSARGEPVAPDDYCARFPEWAFFAELPMSPAQPDPGRTAPAGHEEITEQAPAPSCPGAMAGASLRFRILRPHAEGGLGRVFVAEDRELHREVALKEIKRRHAFDPDFQRRFLREAEITGHLEHPGVVPVYGRGVYDDGRPFYAMRLIRGETLRDAIRRYHQPATPGANSWQRGLELRRLLGRIIAACNTIAYAHSRGVIHRDLKPGNIMLGQYGETWVIDWGLAKAAGWRNAEAESDHAGGATRPLSHGGTDTQGGAAIGTPAYMSPEQAAGQWEVLGPASDIYGLGATLYSLLTGREPIEGRDLTEMMGKARQGDWLRPIKIDPTVPVQLDSICCKAMAFNPAGRYKTALEVAAEIELWLAGPEPTRGGKLRSIKAGLGPGRRTWSAALIALAILAAAALTGISAILWAPGEPPRQSKEAPRTRKLEELFVDLSPAVPVVEAVGLGTGSGFLLKHGDRYLVVTNRHVIENARDGVVVHFLVGDGRGEEGRVTVAKEQTSVVAIHRSADLAVVDLTPAASLIERLKIAPVRLAERGHRPQVGEHVFTIGHPGGGPEGLLTSMLGEGIVSAVGRKGDKGDEARYLQVTVPLNPGNSGGPLFDDQGRVVGVSTFTFRGSESGDDALEALNFALEGDFVHEVVAEPDKSLDAAAIAAVLKPAPVETPKDLLAANAKKLDRLAKLGYHVLRKPRVFRLAPGTQVVSGLECKKGDEFVVLAVSEGGRNLNLGVFSREGRLVAFDERTRPDPEVPFRASADGNYVLAVENASGTETIVVMTLVQK